MLQRHLNYISLVIGCDYIVLRYLSSFNVIFTTAVTLQGYSFPMCLDCPLKISLTSKNAVHLLHLKAQVINFSHSTPCIDV